MAQRNPLFAAVATLATFMSACGGGMQAPPPPPQPLPVTFTSTPPLNAAEATTYTYQIAASDSAGSSVSFSLDGGGPAGATLSGNTLTWTPAPEESRVVNNFRVIARSSLGATASQSWPVTPAGTVHISWVDTHWTAQGSVMEPVDWTKVPGLAGFVAALVPQADGTFQKLTGTGSADGKFAIANVAGGHYWLRMPLFGTYWTSTSNFDFGGNIIGQSFASTSGIQSTGFDLTASGLDPWKVGDLLDFEPNSAFGFAAPGPIPPDATSGTVQQSLRSNIDFSAINSAFVLQYEPMHIGSMDTLALGPSAAVSNLSISNGKINNISATLSASPKSSLNLDVQGSAWATLFDNVAPGAVTPFDSGFSLGAQPYYTGGGARESFGFGEATFALVGTVLALDLSSNLGERLPLTFCPDSDFATNSTFGLPLKGQPPIVTDQNFGSVPFDDPFPQGWIRPLEYCQRAAATIADPSSASPLTFFVTDSQTTTAGTTPIAPILLPVQNPTINGQSLFTPMTLNTGRVSLSWSAPKSQPAPAGYAVKVITKITFPTGTVGFGTFGRFFTASTSITLPFSLKAGDSFLVVISAEADGQANFETSPRRSRLPIASTEVVSALMTVSASAPASAQVSDFVPVPMAAADGNTIDSHQGFIVKPH